MPRPRQPRRIGRLPYTTYFKPEGVSASELTEVRVPLEGLEALRLLDVEGVSLEEAAATMGVSRHTLGRVLKAARKDVAEALVYGRALRIEGGHFAVEPKKPTAKRKRRESEVEKAKTLGRLTKVAVSSEGSSLDAQIALRFGQAPGFVVVDLDTLKHSHLSNEAALSGAAGAGVQAAQALEKAGVSLVLTGSIGPKAHRALRMADIRVEDTLTEAVTVRQAVARFKNETTILDRKVTRT